MDTIRANIIDVVAATQFWGEIDIDRGIITDIRSQGDVKKGEPYLLPGLVDAHIHIESSMLVPDEFAHAALRQGVVASVSDPHEIANVLGVKGIEYMAERASQTPFNILFGAPSCVPATTFETAGASLTVNEIKSLFEKHTTGYLSEVMNFPGVLARDAAVMAKITAAQKLGLPIDGHAPGLLGEDAAKYASAGISTDHECTDLEEALSKIASGMKILIREGSAAKDFQVLHPLLASHPESVMFCSDDKHPDDLMEGHINQLIVRSLAEGHDLFSTLRAATLNPVKHYQLQTGLLQTGDRFDAIQVSDLERFAIDKVWLNGRLVVEGAECLLPHNPVTTLNHFTTEPVSVESLRLMHPGLPCRVINAFDGKLWTKESIEILENNAGFIQADLDRDILLIAIVNRYEAAPPALALIKGFGIKGQNGQGGAIASSVAHDSHNIIAVGTSAEWLEKAINQIIHMKGGLVAVDASGEQSLPLPVAGLMSDQPIENVAPSYKEMNNKVRNMGGSLASPFMTLSFMALLVIPELKLSDKGLFDVHKFEFCQLGVSDDRHAL